MIVSSQTYRRKHSLTEIEYFNGIKITNPFELTIEQETDYARNCPIDYQDGYLKIRLATLEASRSIVNETFDFNSVVDGAEFGCGAYGCFYNYFLPKGVKWRQFDINPKAVEHNRKYNKKLLRKPPKIEIGNLYEMPLDNSSVDVIAGLSTWDSINLFDKAIEEVDRCLRPGGWFVHYQDLHPSEIPIILIEARKRIGRGLDSDIPCEFYSETISGKFPEHFITNEYMVSIDSIEYGLVRSVRYLTKHLESLFGMAGFKIHFSDEIKKEVFVEKKIFNRILKKHRFRNDEPYNCFERAYERCVPKYDPSVPEGYVKQSSSMDVLVAQKP